MIDKWQKRMEKVTANAVFRALQKQKRDFQQYLRNNGIPDDGMLKVVLNRSGNAVVDGFISRVKTTINRSHTDTRKKGPKQPEGLDFSLPTRPEAIYLQSLKDLHLSQRKGSISATTEERVKKLVTSGIKKGQSAKEIANNIEKLDPQVFSKNRADLIAINQIGKAKQFGEFTAMKEFHDAGYVVLKYWSTVNDSRVTRTHTANQGDGWIFHDKTFSGTGDLIPPASDNPRCRCACLYDIGDLKGQKQPKSIEQKLVGSEKRQNFLENFERIKNNYSYKDDALLQRMLENYKGSVAENLKILMPEGTTKEESIALVRWKSDDYLNINAILRSGVSSKYDGLLLNLMSAMNNFPLYRGGVWRGISHSDTIANFQKMEKGDIFVDGGFQSASKEKKVAKNFGNVMMHITSKTGRELGSADTLNEKEVLLMPATQLVFEKFKNGIYYFTEI